MIDNLTYAYSAVVSDDGKILISYSLGDLRMTLFSHMTLGEAEVIHGALTLAIDNGRRLEAARDA